jgi:hypothetical protein
MLAYAWQLCPRVHFLSRARKGLCRGLDVATDLNAGHWSNDLFQVFAALEDSLAGEITAVTPKHVEQIIDDWSGRALQPLLEQLKPGGSLQGPTRQFRRPKWLTAVSSDQPPPEPSGI